VIELSRYALVALREDEEFILYRGRSTDEASGILVLSPVLEYPTPESLKRLEHEHSLREVLDPKWAARPIEIARHWDRTMLVLEDPGGVTLDQLLDPARNAFALADAGGHPSERSHAPALPGDLAFLLRLAIGLSTAIAHSHQRGIIHKDIKPGNVLVNSASGQVWLTGFGVALRLPRERQPPEPPEFIAGTLAYMAPEQTGRMNRSIDSRSDLYAFGVTLYEILTGSLPFTAVDPMEWVHCHIARRPAPPAERSKHVPAAVSAIIMKLLAKTAEQRYQTAAGAESDLRRCLAEWETQRRIDEFSLGEHDTPDRLLIPEKLYGRAREIDTLLASFDRVVKTGRPELVLVSGYSGVGKSSVVNELHKVLVPPRGLFASGKFDQYKRNVPYSTLAEAFQSLLRPLLGRTDAEVRQWRDVFLEALSPNGQLIVDLIPELKLITGELPPVPELPPQDAQRRFQLVLQRFIGVFATGEHPLALFLDDLQWVDTATLDLLVDLLDSDLADPEGAKPKEPKLPRASRPDLQYLLLIGAYRENEVDCAHPLMRKIEEIREARAKVQQIILAPLTCEDLEQLIADCFRCEQQRAAPLAQLVHEKTGGNPLFAIQFLSELSEEALLAFDHGRREWTWDLGCIHAKGYTENVVDLMVGKLNRLAFETQKALQEFACLRHIAQISTLAIVHGASEEQVHADLWEAVRQELIVHLDGRYQFVHDRIQEAAYALIPEGERTAAHLRIGRLLASTTAPDEMPKQVFEIVNQFNRGRALIDSPDERIRVAELNLNAANRAKASTAYVASLAYLIAGRTLLPENSWEQLYELTFALEVQRAECEFLTGDYAAAEERLSMLAGRAANLIDRAAVACLQTELYASVDQNERAVEAGLEYLRRVGIQCPVHPSDSDVRQEYDRIWQQLGQRPIESLVYLPSMTDHSCQAILDVLTALEEPAYFTDQNLRCCRVTCDVPLCPPAYRHRLPFR
jgi:predicted ATPase